MGSNVIEVAECSFEKMISDLEGLLYAIKAYNDAKQRLWDVREKKYTLTLVGNTPDNTPVDKKIEFSIWDVPEDYFTDPRLCRFELCTRANDRSLLRSDRDQFDTVVNTIKGRLPEELNRLIDECYLGTELVVESTEE